MNNKNKLIYNYKIEIIISKKFLLLVESNDFFQSQSVDSSKTKDKLM